jgi:hypothetical protein
VHKPGTPTMIDHTFTSISRLFGGARVVLVLRLALKTNFARTSLFHDYFFNIIAKLWNSIPDGIKDTKSLSSFKRHLKSFYFKRLHLSKVSPCKYSYILFLLALATYYCARLIYLNYIIIL